MRGAAAGVVLSLLLPLLLLEESHTFEAVAGVWRRGAATWFSPLLRPLVTGSVRSYFGSQGRIVFPPQPRRGPHLSPGTAGRGRSSFSFQEGTVFHPQPNREPGSSHLWSAASYYPRWPDRVRHDFTSEGKTSLSKEDARQPRRLPLVQARHQINNPRRQKQDSPQHHRKPSSDSLWYWD